MKKFNLFVAIPDQNIWGGSKTILPNFLGDCSNHDFAPIYGDA